jgi:2-polyprenyl-6-methoxyphenol hydroxylase-like FAD-dependent oxidoreductase
MGASIAGLAAARVLSDQYLEVILVEQDRFENAVEHRRGVPQSRHAHGLLASGQNALEGLFPGLLEEVLSLGAVNCCMTREAHWCFEGGEHVRFESDLKGVLVSRPLIEGMVRERTRAIPNIHLHDGCQAEGLTATSGNNRVTGINIHGSTLSANLVIDATGRGSRSPQWLESMGYDRPMEDRIEVNISYSTRQFRRISHHLNGDLFASIPATPETRKGGVMLAQEGDIWTITLNCYGGHAPTELPAFIEFAKALPASYIYDVVSRAEPVGEARSARFPASVRRRYEHMRRFPEGYLILGDAISGFNPAFGQGMSVAALEALELDKALRQGSKNLAERFFAQVAKVVDSPWSIAAGKDLRMPGVIGPKTPMGRFLNWYVVQLHISARTDSRIAMAFKNVSNLLAPPQSLLKPWIAARVLSGALSRHAARSKAARLEATAKGAF